MSSISRRCVLCELDCPQEGFPSRRESTTPTHTAPSLCQYPRSYCSARLPPPQKHSCMTGMLVRLLRVQSGAGVVRQPLASDCFPDLGVAVAARTMQARVRLVSWLLLTPEQVELRAAAAAEAERQATHVPIRRSQSEAQRKEPTVRAARLAAMGNLQASSAVAAPHTAREATTNGGIGSSALVSAQASVRSLASAADAASAMRAGVAHVRFDSDPGRLLGAAGCARLAARLAAIVQACGSVHMASNEAFSLPPRAIVMALCAVLRSEASSEAALSEVATAPLLSGVAQRLASRLSQPSDDACGMMLALAIVSRAAASGAVGVAARAAAQVNLAAAVARSLARWSTSTIAITVEARAAAHAAHSQMESVVLATAAPSHPGASLGTMTANQLQVSQPSMGAVSAPQAVSVAAPSGTPSLATLLAGSGPAVVEALHTLGQRLLISIARASVEESVGATSTSTEGDAHRPYRPPQSQPAERSTMLRRNGRVLIRTDPPARDRVDAHTPADSWQSVTKAVRGLILDRNNTQAAASGCLVARSLLLSGLIRRTAPLQLVSVLSFEQPLDSLGPSSLWGSAPAFPGGSDWSAGLSQPTGSQAAAIVCTAGRLVKSLCSVATQLSLVAPIQDGRESFSGLDWTAAPSAVLADPLLVATQPHAVLAAMMRSHCWRSVLLAARLACDARCATLWAFGHSPDMGSSSERRWSPRGAAKMVMSALRSSPIPVSLPRAAALLAVPPLTAANHALEPTSAPPAPSGGSILLRPIIAAIGGACDPTVLLDHGVGGFVSSPAHPLWGAAGGLIGQAVLVGELLAAVVRAQLPRAAARLLLTSIGCNTCTGTVVEAEVRMSAPRARHATALSGDVWACTQLLRLVCDPRAMLGTWRAAVSGDAAQAVAESIGSLCHQARNQARSILGVRGFRFAWALWTRTAGSVAALELMPPASPSAFSRAKTIRADPTQHLARRIATLRPSDPMDRFSLLRRQVIERAISSESSSESSSDSDDSNQDGLDVGVGLQSSSSSSSARRAARMHAGVSKTSLSTDRSSSNSRSMTGLEDDGGYGTNDEPTESGSHARPRRNSQSSSDSSDSSDESDEDSGSYSKRQRASGSSSHSNDGRPLDRRPRAGGPAVATRRHRRKRRHQDRARWELRMQEERRRQRMAAREQDPFALRGGGAAYAVWHDETLMGVLGLRLLTTSGGDNKAVPIKLSPWMESQALSDGWDSDVTHSSGSNPRSVSLPPIAGMIHDDLFGPALEAVTGAAEHTQGGLTGEGGNVIGVHDEDAASTASSDHLSVEFVADDGAGRSTRAGVGQQHAVILRSTDFDVYEGPLRAFRHRIHVGGGVFVPSSLDELQTHARRERDRQTTLQQDLADEQEDALDAAAAAAAAAAATAGVHEQLGVSASIEHAHPKSPESKRANSPSVINLKPSPSHRSTADALSSASMSMDGLGEADAAPRDRGGVVELARLSHLVKPVVQLPEPVTMDVWSSLPGLPPSRGSLTSSATAMRPPPSKEGGSRTDGLMTRPSDVVSTQRPTDVVLLRLAAALSHGDGHSSALEAASTITGTVASQAGARLLQSLRSSRAARSAAATARATVLFEAHSGKDPISGLSLAPVQPSQAPLAVSPAVRATTSADPPIRSRFSRWKGGSSKPQRGALSVMGPPRTLPESNPAVDRAIAAPVDAYKVRMESLIPPSLDDKLPGHRQAPTGLSAASLVNAELESLMIGGPATWRWGVALRPQLQSLAGRLESRIHRLAGTSSVAAAVGGVGPGWMRPVLRIGVDTPAKSARGMSSTSGRMRSPSPILATSQSLKPLDSAAASRTLTSAASSVLSRPSEPPVSARF